MQGTIAEKENRAECFKGVYYSNLGKKKTLQRASHDKNKTKHSWTRDGQKKNILQAKNAPPHPSLF